MLMKDHSINFARMRLPVGLIAAFITVGLLSGCASPARSDRMTVSSDFGQVAKIPADNALRGNVGVASVTGGGDTNPMWRSKVSSDAFQRALEDSLRNAMLLNPAISSSRYQLTADLINLSQPLAGASLEVSSSVRYSLVERASRKEIYSRVIQTAHTAKWNDAFNFNDRLNIANEGAIRNNIQLVIDDLFKLNLQ